MKNKVICILTTAHPTDDVRVFEKFVNSFNLSGFTVKWIGPDFAFFPQERSTINIGWSLFKKREGFAGRIISIWNCSRLVAKGEYVDYYYCPDPDAALIAILFKRKSEKLVFDIHEAYHKELLHKRLGFTFVRLFERIVLSLICRIVAKSEVVVAVSQKILSYYSRHDHRNAHILVNCPSAALGYSETFDSDCSHSVYTFIHGKNHMTRGTSVVLNAISILKKDVRYFDFKVLMIDSYSNETISKENEFQRNVSDLKISKYIDLRHGMTFNEMQSLTSKSNVGIIAYGRDLGVDSLPNRLFEFMAAGLPVIVPEYSVEIVKIVNKYNCGLTIDMEDPSSLANAMKYFIDNPDVGRTMGKNGRIAFLEYYNWEAQFDKFVEIIK